jgi:hypothetical protein
MINANLVSDLFRSLPTETPEKFTQFLDGQEPAEVKLRVAGGGLCMWPVEVMFDMQGQMYLNNGWKQFARAQNIEIGCFINLAYDGGDGVLTLKVFDGKMCEARL